MEGSRYEDAHRTVAEAAEAGRTADFRRPTDSAELPAFDDDELWDGRTISGEWLTDFLCDESSKVHRRGVHIEGARIKGDFDLTGATVTRRLSVCHSNFGDTIVELQEASLRLLDLEGSTCGGINANLAHFTGSVFLNGGFHAKGEVQLLGASVGGELNCDGGTFDSPNGDALSADRAQITGGVFLRYGFHAKGEVCLVGVSIGGALECGGGTFENPSNMALNAVRAQVAGTVYLHDEFRARGEVCLVGASIGGQLVCNGGTFDNPNGYALDIFQARVAGTVFLEDKFRARGEVRVLAANIGGALNCDGGTFENPGGDALNAYAAQITGGMFLRNGFRASGEVSVVVASIGPLNCQGGIFENPGGVALNARAVQVGGGVRLRDGFRARGEVRLLGASIGGALECDAATFEHPDGYALNADGTQVTGSVFLRSGFRAKGEVRLLGASIGGQLDCDGGTFENPNSVALSAEGAQVTGHVILRNGFHAEGRVSFVHASAGALVDDEASWPAQMRLTGFRYDRLVGPTGWKARRRWLSHQVDYDAQPYLHLAAVLRAQGHERDARKIAMVRHNETIRPPAHWREAGDLGFSWARAVWRTVLRCVIGHGYEPWRALLFAVPIFVVMTFWYADAARHDLLQAIADDPTRPTGDVRPVVSSACDSDYGCPQPAVLALDTLLPVVDLGQRSAWAPDQSRHAGRFHRDGRWLAAATWVTTLMGWALATLTAVGLTNIIRRE